LRKGITTSQAKALLNEVSSNVCPMECWTQFPQKEFFPKTFPLSINPKRGQNIETLILKFFSKSCPTLIKSGKISSLWGIIISWGSLTWPPNPIRQLRNQESLNWKNCNLVILLSSKMPWLFPSWVIWPHIYST